jgi:hypothetical protein
MFLYAYLLFTNIATMAGLVFALMMQSRMKDDDLTGNRIDRRRYASASLSRAARMPESTLPR